MSRGVRMLSGVEHVDLTVFPSNPRQGTDALVNGVRYTYTTIDGVQTWYPLNKPPRFKKHVQGVASLNWSFNHQFTTKDIIIIVYGSDDSVISCDVRHVYDEVNDWYTTNITLAEADTGYAVAFVDDAVNVPHINADTMAISSTLTVGGSNVATQGDLTAKLDTTAFTGAAVQSKLLTVGIDFNDFITVNDTIDGGEV